MTKRTAPTSASTVCDGHTVKRIPLKHRQTGHLCIHNEKKNRTRENGKIKLSFQLKLLLLCMPSPDVQNNKGKNVDRNISLVDGNNIKRTTASIQSAYKTESCSYPFSSSRPFALPLILSFHFFHQIRLYIQNKITIITVVII